MSLKSIKQAAAAYFAAEKGGTVREQILASRQLGRECARTLESVIGHGIEARVVFYPPEKTKAKKKDKADHSASSSTTSS